MQKWERPRRRDRKVTAPSNGNRHQTDRQPSFSSALLDAVYRSLDEEDSSFGGPRTGGTRIKKEAAGTRKDNAVERVVPRGYRGSFSPHKASVSSGLISGAQSSTYYDSVVVDETPPPPRPIRVLPWKVPKQSIPATRKKAASWASTHIRAIESYEKLRNGKQPASPGARLASFLTGVFSGASVKPRKAKSPTISNPAKLNQSSESSCSLSCLVRTPSSIGCCSKISNRYCLQVVDHTGERPTVQAAGNARNVPSMSSIAEGRKLGGEAARELVRRCTEKMGIKEVEADVVEDDSMGSRSSTDLFELENLAAIGGGAADDGCLDKLLVESPHFEMDRVARVLQATRRKS